APGPGSPFNRLRRLIDTAFGRQDPLLEGRAPKRDLEAWARVASVGCCPSHSSPSRPAATGRTGPIPRHPPRRDRSPRLRSSISATWWFRSEEHTSELQSRETLVCRLLLE